MKKINRTYIMGVLVLALAAWIGWQTSQLPTRFVSNEPGPKLFPYTTLFRSDDADDGAYKQRKEIAGLKNDQQRR